LPGFSASQFEVFGSEFDVTGPEASWLFVLVAASEEVGGAGSDPVGYASSKISVSLEKSDDV